MKIELITPATRSNKGNWVTASRWAKILRQLGHQVAVQQEYSGQDCDLLLALHALKSFGSVERFHRKFPNRPVILTLTGTDLYRDIRSAEAPCRAMAWAHRLILLQPTGIEELPPQLQQKCRIIRQSATAATAQVAPVQRWFDVCVIGHLRPVKDPFRTARAARLLPQSSKIRVLHAGAALSHEMEQQALAEMEMNRRYKWLGDRPQWQVRRLLARSRVMVLTSEMEGGANVISEALVAGCPVLSTRISGSIGMLGKKHPGYFQVGDTAGLAALLKCCESDPGFLDTLAKCSDLLAPQFHPDREIEAWAHLLADL